MKRIARLLIRFRHLLLMVMTALGVAGVFLLPEINIVSDMTTYLPDNSRMKQGLECMKSSFSGIDTNGAGVSAMFSNEAVSDSLSTELSEIEGIAAIIGHRSNERHTLYQFILDPDASPDTVAETISRRYGNDVTVETASTNLLPDNMNFIIIAGVSLLTLILVIMCSSIVEVILFLIAIGIAVAINMGSNAFMPGVSVVTSAIAAILQLILSMDYSIILMNRYRQARKTVPEKTEAMTCALAEATPAILSSAATTILGMAMLAFMNFKIGLDMGLVLSKGVFLSLVSIYCVLPALVLTFDKAIQKTQKKVPLLHTYKLAKFEVRFRRLIAVAFILFFAGSYFLSKRTSISFSNTWPTEITSEFPPQNQIVMLYENDEEEKIISLIDSIGSDPRVMTAMSYPSIMMKERTADEMMKFIKETAAMLPGGAEQIDSTMLTADMLDLVYYAAAHPERDEKMSFSEIERFASELPEEYLGNLNPEKMMQDIMNKLIEDGDEIEEPVPDAAYMLVPAMPQTPVEQEMQTSPVASPEDTVTSPETILHDTVTTAAEPDTIMPSIPTSRFTFENSTLPMTSREMADFLGFDRKQAFAVYKIAGKSKSRMTAQEFVHYVSEKLINNRVYSAMMSRSQVNELAAARHQIDSAVLAGTSRLAKVELTAPSALVADTVKTDSLPSVVTPTAKDTTIQAAPIPATAMATDEATGPVVMEKSVPAPEPTPLEVLIDMAGSNRKYSSDRIGRTLRNAGIDIAQSDVDLLFMYYGSRNSNTDSLKMSIEGLMDFMTGTLLTDPMYDRFIDGSAEEGILAMRRSITEGLGNLRGEKYSIATIISDYEAESDETFAFVSSLKDKCDKALEGECYLIGESVMYKEMSDGFTHEMRVVTSLTIIVIFLVVALTFRSAIVPVFLLLIVMSAVYVCVFIGGVDGKPLNYLAYLVTQSILMGATIDYAILFTDYYREKRMTLPIMPALRKSYKNTIHSIMTSGLILILCPYIMSILMTDPTISIILKSISVGALAAILLILLVLPGLLAAFDRIVTQKGSHPDTRDA